MISFADKVGRKVRVSLDIPKVTRGGSRVSGTRGSNTDKAKRKVRLAFHESKRVSGDYRIDHSEKNGIKGVNRRSTLSDSVSFVDVDGKSKRITRGRVSLKKKEEGEIFSGNSTQRRKRIYADSGMTVGRARGSNNRMSNFNSEKDGFVPYMDERKEVQRGKFVQFKDSNRNLLSTGGRKFKGNGMGKMENADKFNFREHGLRDGASKTSYKRKASLHTGDDVVMPYMDETKKMQRGKNVQFKDSNRNVISTAGRKSKGNVGNIENTYNRNFPEHGLRDGASDTSYKWKDPVPTAEDVVMPYLDEGKKVQRGKNVRYNDSNRHIRSTGARKSYGNGRDNMGNADKLNIPENRLRNGATRTNYKRKAPVTTGEDMNQKQQTVGSVEKIRKKKDQGKKIMATDSDIVEKPKRKKKRGIRLDPHDISNKRLVDGSANNGDDRAKVESKLNAAVEMSKNAQFRAIIPSASILTFVEDNLLGRRRDIDFRRAGYNPELSCPLDNIPFSDGSERERIEVPVFRSRMEFFAAAKTSLSFPSPDLPEIAFAGRSNVGKSSLLNALTRQWGVVRTSDKPGLTQTINFFKLGPKLCLVDLPGYGFAYAKEEVKESWEELVKEYVSTRIGLKRVCLLVDTKWGMKPRDHELIDLMERSETKYQIVLTKTDSVFPIDVARRAMEIEENLKANKSAVQPLMMVSSRTGAGIRSLRTVLAKIARLVKH